MRHSGTDRNMKFKRQYQEIFPLQSFGKWTYLRSLPSSSQFSESSAESSEYNKGAFFFLHCFLYVYLYEKLHWKDGWLWSYTLQCPQNSMIIPNRFHQLEQGVQRCFQDQHHQHHLGVCQKCQFSGCTQDPLNETLCWYGPVTCFLKGLSGDSNAR